MNEKTSEVATKLIKLGIPLFFIGLLIVGGLSSSFFGDVFSSYSAVYLYLAAWIILVFSCWFAFRERRGTRKLTWLFVPVAIISVLYPVWTTYRYPRKRLIYAAATYNHHIILRLLVRHSGPDEINEALVAAAASGHASIVRDMLFKSADPNARLMNGPTALMEAVWSGSAETVQLLLNSGARVNDKDKSGETALMWAAKRNNLDAAKLLIAAGADLQARNNRNETALAISKEFSFQEVSMALSGAGARE